MLVRGIDVSAVQGKLPWDKLTDIDFVICKAVEGNQGFDPDFWDNVKGAQVAGKLAAAYHFVFPLRHIDPKWQARQFYEQTRGFGSNVGELPPMVDWEWPPPEQWAKWKVDAVFQAEWMRALCEEMTRLYGCKPLIYIYPYFLDCLVKGGADLSWCSEHGLVIADYSRPGSWPDDMWEPSLKPSWPWKKWVMCQFDGNGGLKLPNGVDCDFDVFNGDLADLRAMAGLAPEKPFIDGDIVHPMPDDEVLVGA